jgi:hypothetical protein
MTLAGTGIVGIVTPVHELVKHLYHLACGNIDDSHVLALTGFQKTRIVTEGMPAQAYLTDYFEINHTITENGRRFSGLSAKFLLLTIPPPLSFVSAVLTLGARPCLGMKSNPCVLWFCFG